ncbi:MAG: nitrogen fixation-related uncharacterized protein [Dokdonia sp.]|jgi:nitrogen fixation-related uncharacterized protein
MISIPVFIFIGIIILWILLFFVFRKQYRSCLKKHQEILFLYSEEFQLHKKQMKKRMMSLNKYDLLQYNISESLIVQHQIKL